jgi:hypothetical protein
VHAPPVHDRQFVPARYSHALPGRSVQVAGQAQLAVQTLYEQGSQSSMRVAPGAHTPSPMHEPASAGPKRQVSRHMRVTRRMPQFPHGSIVVCAAPGTHSPDSPLHRHGPQAHEASQVRTSRPHMPQAPPISVVPGVHTPGFMQAPSSVQRPSTHVCRCMPQNPHGTVRGASPALQSQVAGAVQGIHVPSRHCSTPVPHGLEQDRSASRPIAGFMSSQSSARGTPSPSLSAAGSTHTPPRHTRPPVQAGVQLAGGPASTAASSAIGPRSSRPRIPPSIPEPPLAHPATRSAAIAATRALAEATGLRALRGRAACPAASRGAPKPPANRTHLVDIPEE